MALILIGVPIRTLGLLSLAGLGLIIVLTSNVLYRFWAAVVGAVWVPPFGFLDDSELLVIKGVSLTAVMALIYLTRSSAGSMAARLSAGRNRTLRPLTQLLSLLSLGWVLGVGIGTGSIANGLLFALGFLGVIILLASGSSALVRPESAGPAFLIAIGLTAIGDIAMFYAGTGFDIGINAGRFNGSIGDYELLGQFYAISCVIGLGIFYTSDHRFVRSAAFVVLALSFFILLQTQSRSSLILSIGGMILVSTLSVVMWDGSRRRVVTFLGLVAVVSPFSLLPLLSNSATVERFASVRFDGSLSVLLNREFVWDYFLGLESFAQAGWAGNGFDFPYDDIGTFPHSLYLYLVWSIGWVGLFLFVSTFFCLLVFALTQHVDAPFFSWKHVLIIALSMLLIEQVKIEMTREFASQSLFWCLVFCLVGLLVSRSPERLVAIEVT